MGEERPPRTTRKYLEAKAAIADGRDPSAEVRKRKEDMLYRDFVEDLFLPHQRAEIRSHYLQEKMPGKYVLPRLGDKRLREIVRTDVTRLRDLVREASESLVESTSEPGA